MHFGDPQEYANLAIDILNGKYISATRPPLYPVFIAFFFKIFGIKASYFIIPLIQHIIGLITGYVIYRITGSSLAFCFYSCNPIITLYESSLYSENLYIPLTLIAYYYFRVNKFFMAYTFVALSALARPTALIIAIIIFTFHLIQVFKYKRLMGIYFITIVLVVYFIWGFYQMRNFDYFFFSTIGKFNISLYQANYIYAENKGIDIKTARKEWLLKIYEKGEFYKKYPIPDTSVFDMNYSAYWEYRNYPDIVDVAFNEAIKLYLSNPRPVILFALKGMTLSAINNGFYPLIQYFHYENYTKKLQKLKELRHKIYDNILLNFNIKSAISALYEMLKMFPSVFIFSILYNFISLYLFYKLLRNTISRNVEFLALCLFLISWFIAGFAGIGGIRHFVAGYPFLIIVSYSKEKN